ncbi:MAG: UbiA family prenyltransferase [Bryobacterales bacterium]|nr:UbiA family prenyltransferase [Bryobacterales bacterium]
MKGRAAETLRAYTELLRISNLPTVFSNVLVGSALGGSGANIPWEITAQCAVAVLFLYLAGVACNDAVDAEWDAVARPERPIPSGRLSQRQAYTITVIGFMLGLAVFASIGLIAFGIGTLLVAVITLYNLFHKRLAASVVFVGAARGLVYLAAAAAVGGTLNDSKPFWFALALFAYTTAFTVMARSEHQEQIDNSRWLAAAIPLIALTPGVWIMPDEALLAAGVAVVMIVWQARAVKMVLQVPPETKSAVHVWLSGFCLIDAFYFSVLGYSGLIVVAVGCFLVTLLLQRRVMGT